MSLKIKLKPKERILIAGALVVNGDSPAQLHIENKVPLLREKDMLSEAEATTLCQKIYFVIQLMYFSPGNLKELHGIYWQHVRTLLKASPSAIGMVSDLSELILVEKYYNALKLCKELIEYENQLISHAKKSA